MSDFNRGARMCVQWPRLGPYHVARLRALDNECRRRGWSLTALETASSDTLYEWREVGEDVPFERMQAFPAARFDDLSPRQVRSKIISMLDDIDPRAVIINSYSFPDARAALEWCRTRRRTAVVLMESKEDDAERVPFREWMKARIVRQFDSAVAGGSPQRDYLHTLGFPANTIFFPYDVVDNEFFRREAAASKREDQSLPGLTGESPFFLASNRFIERKNLPMLLRAYSRYRAQTDRPWRLLMLGDGPLRLKLEALVREEHIDGVVFCGFRQLEDLPHYYARASAFVHSAENDQWGLVVNEAMASGLPVIVSRGTGCHRDLVREGINGFTFAPTDERALADLLVRIADPSRDLDAMGRASEEIIRAFSPERFALAVFDAVAAGEKSRDRGFDPVARLGLWLLRIAGRRQDSFHRVQA